MTVKYRYMQKINNPFITSGYLSKEYFCDRKTESAILLKELLNGNNIALISTRRMGKTGLIQHCFADKAISYDHYTFFIDIYSTKSLREFVFALSKVILNGLKPHGRKALEKFWNSLKSLQTGISFDLDGSPSFNVQLGDIATTEQTLDEIFLYLEQADKPCIVAIDEFQQITSYPEQNIEAILRTHVQHCTNTKFIFAGSQRHTMGNIFLGASRPFYQSVSMMHLESIPLGAYTKFAQHHFAQYEKTITPDVVETIYTMFEGITWYMQKTLNVLFSQTNSNEICTVDMINPAIESVLDTLDYTYSEILFRLPEKQKELLIAITQEGKASELTSGDFVRRYHLNSPSSVQSALRGLLEKDFITYEQGNYCTYDRFFALWLMVKY